MSVKKGCHSRCITVVGGGSFGTALANIAAHNNHRVTLWMRDPEQVQDLNRDHVNSRYLPDFDIHPTIRATIDLAEATESADIIFVAIPSHSFRSVVRRITVSVKGKMVISTTKGVEPETFSLMSEILTDELGEAIIGVLSGPNLAKEIVARAYTATVVASSDAALCECVQEILQSDYFRVYSNHDVYGVELAGALKNIYAIVTGIGAALGMGENTKSMIITRSLAEMSRFAVASGADPMTFLGLAGVGDLVATCTSSLSRNYRLGYALGKGEKLVEAEASLGQVAEGVNTLQQVWKRARSQEIYMPIVESLHRVLFEESVEIDALVKSMMLREQKTDVEFMVRH